MTRVIPDETEEGSPEECRRDAAHHADDAEGEAEKAVALARTAGLSVADQTLLHASLAVTSAHLAVASRLGQLAAVLSELLESRR